MTKKERVRYEMFVRLIRFLLDNLGLFAAGGVVATQFAVLQGVVERIRSFTGEQSAGMSEARYNFDTKATARENLRELLSEIASTARSMVYKFPGIDLKFRMLRGDNDAALLAKARAFLTEAAPYEADFILNEMNERFLSHLQELIEAFEQSMSETGSAIDSHVEATADVGEEIRQGMIAFRTMKGAVLNKFRNDPGKLAAWISASHIEKIPYIKKVEDPPAK